MLCWAGWTRWGAAFAHCLLCWNPLIRSHRPNSPQVGGHLVHQERGRGVVEAYEVDGRMRIRFLENGETLRYRVAYPIVPHATPDQTRPDQTRSDHNRPDQTRPDQTRPDQTRPDQTRPSQSRPDQTRPPRSRPQHTRPHHTICYPGIPHHMICSYFAEPHRTVPYHTHRRVALCHAK